MSFSLLKNLSTTETENGYPWDFKHPGYPKVSKKKWADFIIDPTLEWCFFSGVIGANPSIRIGPNNPARIVKSIVVEYDRHVDDEDLEKIENRWNPEYPPNYVCRTRGRGVRLIWILEDPIVIQGDDHYKRFMLDLDDQLYFSRLLPGFDKNCLKSNMYHEASVEWEEIHTKPLSSKIVTFIRASSLEASQDFKDAPKLSFKVIEEEAEKRWPGRWGSEYAVNQRGSRFWDDDTWEEGAPNAVVMFEGGCFNYSTTHGKPGLNTWADVFGRKFVERHEQERLGHAIRDFFYDGKQYWRSKNDGSLWLPCSSLQTTRHLRVDYGLESKTKKDSESEVDKAITLIENTKYVQGIVPFLHIPDKVVYIDGMPYLNDSQNKPVEPVQESVDLDDFPLIIDMLAHNSESDLEVHRVLNHMKSSYETFYSFSPRVGQVLLIAGPPACGKTAFGLLIYGPLLGGVGNATSYILGESRFNSDLCRKPLWLMDDEEGGKGQKSKDKRTAMFKRTSANPTVDYERKYGNALNNVPSYSRILITCNEDPASLNSLMPDLDNSIRDKFLAVLWKGGFSFPKNLVSTISKELPYFARYLLEYNPPKEIVTNSRYGTGGYVHPEIELAAVTNSNGYGFLEVLDIWKRSLKNNGEKEWRGTATDLWAEVSRNETLPKLLGSNVSSTQVGHMLNGLIRQGHPGISSHFNASGRREFHMTL